MMGTKNSFVENINILANAQALVTGDIVEDTKVARDEAVEAAAEAKISETNSKASETLAKDWAEKGHNNPVVGTPGVDAEYSSYHWATEASLAIGDPIINDNIISANYTWSSSKLSNALNNKSEITHNHDGVYEHAFVKRTAFNKDFAGTGNNDTISRSDHNHDTAYMPKVVENTAYNKDFGTISGTVMEGSHRFDSDYMPKVPENTAYNKNFVVDPNAPLADEVPRGNHTHKAVGVIYDPTNNVVVTSGTAQGAITQLDARLGSIEVAEKCKLTAAMTNPTYVVSFSDTTTYVPINAGMTVGTEIKNAIYNNGVQIKYPVAPDKLVEGNYIATATLLMTANTEYELSMMLNGAPIPGTQVQVGPFANTDSVPVTAGGFVSILQNDDVIGVGVRNLTDTTSLTITGLMVSFAGEPEGNLVISGSTVNHDEILGRDQVAQHPTSSIYQTGNTAVDLDTLLGQKADKVIGGVADNLVTLDANGNIQDSRETLTSLTNKVDKPTSKVLDNILVMDSNGNAVDGGLRVQDLALVGGSATQQFQVADGTNTNDAVNYGQMNTLAGTFATKTEFNTHVATANPHNTSYSDVGAAPLVHTHSENDVTGLTDSLNSKYDKVATPVTGNVPAFGAGGVLVDSGKDINTVDSNALAYAVALG